MSGTFAAGADMKSEEEEVLALHNDFLDLFATDVTGKFTELLEIIAGARCPDDERNASQLCDERRDIIVVDIAAALMVLLYIIIIMVIMLCDWRLSSCVCRVSMLTPGGFLK